MKDMCTNKNKGILPKKPIPMNFRHFFLRGKDLYHGKAQFLHCLLQYIAKTHAERVAESTGNYTEIHCDNKTGLNIEDVGK